MTALFRGQITLDGPSGTGKSSVARAVARRVGAAYLDTGAMYRAATVVVLDAGVDPEDAEAVAAVVAGAKIEVGMAADLRRRDEYDSSRADSPLRPAADAVVVDSTDLDREAVVDRVVDLAVSAVSAVPAVRRRLVDQQRALVAAADAVVVEGRDIGTVVLPDATLKVYLTAAPEARAQRRAAQLGITDPAEVAALAADLRRRDEYDSSRADSPLRPAEDAVVVDSTDLDREGVVGRVVELARSAVGAQS